MVTKTSAEAQNNFGQLLDLAQHEPVAITRHGRPTVYVLSVREMEEIEQEREKWRKRTAADWEEWRERAKQSMSPDSAALTGEDINRMVHESR
jgi:antitoxin Phd